MNDNVTSSDENVLPMISNLQQEKLREIAIYCELESCSKIEAAIALGYYQIVRNFIWEDPFIENGHLKDRVLQIFKHCPAHLQPQFQNIADVIQFNRDTVFFHSLGVLASASIHGVKIRHYEHDKPIPLNAYFVAAELPASGKSGVNSLLCRARSSILSDFNNDNKIERNVLIRKISVYKRQIDKIIKSPDGDSLNSVADIKRLERDISIDTEKLRQFPVYSKTYVDFTKESLRYDLEVSNGKIAIVSDESGAMKSLFGNMYKSSDATKENNLVVAGWKSEEWSAKRSGSSGTVERTDMEMPVTITVASLAQPLSIKTLLSGSLDGDGAAQRFSYFETTPRLGYRDHLTDHELMSGDIFGEIWRNVFYADVTLELSKDASNYVKTLANEIEPSMQSGRVHSHPALVGYVGKIKDHLIKIAGLYLLMNHWHNAGSKTTIIEIEHVRVAKAIFDASLHTFKRYLSIINGKSDTVSKLVIERLVAKCAPRYEPISFTAFAQSIKNLKAFEGISGFSKYLKNVVFKELEECNVVYMHNDIIYVNPKCEELLMD